MKGTLSRRKRQPTDWEKTSADRMADKGLISIIPEAVLQFNSKKKQPNHKMGKGLE